MLGAYLVLTLAADYRGVDYEVLKQRVAHLRVEVCPYRLEQLVPVTVGVIDYIAERGHLTGHDVELLVQLFHPVHQLGYVLIRIVIQILNHFLQTIGFNSLGHSHIGHRDFLQSLSCA